MSTYETDHERVQHHHGRESGDVASPSGGDEAEWRAWRNRAAPIIRSVRPRAGSELFWKIVAGNSAPGHARGLLMAWIGWERLSEKFWPTVNVPQAPNGLVRIRIRAYRRAPVMLPGGLEVPTGAIIADLHCNNRALLRLMLTSRNPFTACRQDLRGLARWIDTDPRGRRIIALHARTLFAKGASRYGFTPVPTPITIHRRLQRIFFIGLLMVYSEEGARRLRHGTTHHAYPQDVWISRKDMLRIYLRSDARNASRTVRDARTCEQSERSKTAPTSASN